MKLSNILLTACLACYTVLSGSTVYGQTPAPIKIWIPGWKQTAPLNTARAGAAVVEKGNKLYVLGGIDGRDFLATTEMATVQTDGPLSSWQLGPELNEPRGFHGAVVFNDFVYVVGGGNGPAGHNLLRSVERASIQADGSLGPWRRESSMLLLPRRCVKVVAYANRLYALGGFSGALLDSVESAPILSDGTLGPWVLDSQALTIPRYVHDAKLAGDTLWVVGGHREDQGVGLSQAETRQLSQPGSTWQAITPLARGRYGLSLAVHTRFIYALGGLDGAEFLRTIERLSRETPPSSNARWTPTGPLSSSRANFSATFNGDVLYVIGGTNAMGYYDTVEYATVNAHGELGFWGTRDDAKAFEKGDGGTQATIPLPTGNTGIIKESISAGGYTYLRVDTQQGEQWLATAQGDFPVDSHVTFSEGVKMTQFKSKSLSREFETIRFVSQVRIVGPGASKK